MMIKIIIINRRIDNKKRNATCERRAYGNPDQHKTDNSYYLDLEVTIYDEWFDY